VVDAQRLPFPDASFDVVIANHMLYHVPVPADAVAELSRVTRPGGCLLAAANGPANLEELWQIRAEIFGQPPVDRTTEAFGCVTGRPILQACFNRVAWHTYSDELRCTNADDVVAYLTSSPPGEDADQHCLDALAATVRAHFDGPEALFRITKDTGAFVASGPLQPR
jgi:SAM-dependent methyltransferase